MDKFQSTRRQTNGYKIFTCGGPQTERSFHYVEYAEQVTGSYLKQSKEVVSSTAKQGLVVSSKFAVNNVIAVFEQIVPRFTASGIKDM